MSEEDLNNISSYSKETYGFSDEIPSSYSLEKYVPPIGDQYDSGSCVAWATSYYAMSIIYNSTYGITSYAGKYTNRFDPWFLYNQISYQRLVKYSLHIFYMLLYLMPKTHNQQNCQ